MYFIAEIGQNHQGDLKTAKKIIDSLVGTGVNAVKSAKRTVHCFPDEWKTTPYDSVHSFGATYYDHRVALELSYEEWIEMASYAKDKGFDFIASFTDLPALQFIEEYLNPAYYKIASSRLTDLELLRAVSGPSILSTGMSDIEDIKTAVEILDPACVMQCTSSYPTSDGDLHVNAVRQFKELGWVPGFSSHSFDFISGPLARACGAEFFEYHVTLSQSMKGRDHIFSMLGSDYKILIDQVKRADEMMGGEKRILDSEQENIKKLRHDLRI